VSVPKSSSEHGEAPKSDMSDFSLPDGWEAGLATTIHQRMLETQDMVNAHLDDELGRSLYTLDIMGSD
jgi:hypothetical protein